jgi:hypothetical protein
MTLKRSKDLGFFFKNSLPTAHERVLVCRVLVYTFNFTIANSFTDLFWQKSARKVTGNFLHAILNVWFAKYTWIFLLFWDWKCT